MSLWRRAVNGKVGMATLSSELTAGEQLSLRIREVRKIAAKTQVEFAAAIGVSRSYLSEVEARKVKPSIEMVLGVASHFPTIASPSWFLLGYGQPGPYEESLLPGGLDFSCVHYCLSLLESPQIKQKLRDDTELTARALTVLISVYISGFQMVLLEQGSAVAARLEAEGRSDQIAAAMEINLDEVVAAQVFGKAGTVQPPHNVSSVAR